MLGKPNSKRLVPLDWMRGLVMALMALDHASAVYNKGRLALDSAATYPVGTPLPLDQFITRWITHLSAPTFVFLAGTALALTCERRMDNGDSAQAITRYMVTRGLIIAAFDILWISPFIAQKLLLQVLFAIGISMVAMAWLRRFSSTALVVLATSWFLAGEAFTLQCWQPPTGNPSLAAALTIAPYYSDTVTIIYPVIPWLAVMMLGWAFGRYLVAVMSTAAADPVRLFVFAGAALLIVFLIVRGLSGYGNMMLLRGNDSLSQWLHVSKYPPSLTFVALELGLMSLCLAALMIVEKHIHPSPNNPLLVFGQTALFFYLLHMAVLGAPAVAFDLIGKGSLVWAYGAALTTLVVLYPICHKYRSYKSTHPDSWVRYI